MFRSKYWLGGIYDALYWGPLAVPGGSIGDISSDADDGHHRRDNALFNYLNQVRGPRRPRLVDEDEDEEETIILLLALLGED